MINDLRYAVTFPTNGVSLSGQFSFQPGSTAISGRNGTGKSFIAEMIRYGLFGKRALRGPASDYKTLNMELSFLGYSVSRGKKETLTDQGHEIIAVGADAVNKKIVDLLGFDLEVFDVVCAANQKESERLTRLTPARRKELIDDVVGLTRQETVEKACREEAKMARIEAETLARTLVVPEEPAMPEGYRPSADVAKELAETKELEANRARLLTIVNSVGEEPVEPERELLVSIEELEAHEKLRVQNDAQRAAIERNIASIPTTTVTLEQIEQAEALAAYDAEVARRGPRPDHSLEQLNEWRGVWGKKQIANYGSTTCPSCSHRFVVDVTERDVDVEAVLALADPPIKPKEIGEQELRHAYWKDELVKPKGTRLTPTEISVSRMALAMDKPRLERELAAFELLDDRSAELREARRLDREWDIYARDFQEHLKRRGHALLAQTELDQLPVAQSSVAELDAAFVAARIYETQLTNYAEQRQRFDELTQEIGEKQQRAEAFLDGAKGLVEARRTLKAYLAPSLSRVASKIIQQMTENSLRPLDSIEVDEDMNITADGQDVGTFNGAHATMINLALRLALGQVLVARVFPVFIGDEIDSDADDENSQMIADALMACKDQLKQIVLISHKRLEGVDHEVML